MNVWYGKQRYHIVITNQVSLKYSGLCDLMWSISDCRYVSSCGHLGWQYTKSRLISAHLHCFHICTKSNVMLYYYTWYVTRSREMSHFPISIFLHHFLRTSKCFILMQTPLQLDIWLRSYERFDNAKNNIKQRNLNTVFANISKTTSPTSDSFLLIMSHISMFEMLGGGGEEKDWLLQNIYIIPKNKHQNIT